jgi:hypothetical protein
MNSRQGGVDHRDLDLHEHVAVEHQAQGPEDQGHDAGEQRQQGHAALDHIAQDQGQGRGGDQHPGGGLEVAAGGEEGHAEGDRRAIVDGGAHPGGVLFLGGFGSSGGGGGGVSVIV